MKSVFIVNGFLESGKTEFIIFTMQQEYFQTKGKTLLLLCEEGETSYDEQLLQRTNTALEVVESKEQLQAPYFLEMEKKYKPERILIEYNGMWSPQDLKLPWHWKIDQQVTVIDATTFSSYFTNMRSMFAQMVRFSELIIFNRCDGIAELATYKKNMMAMNREAEIVFEDSNGEVNVTLEEELPYDVNKDIIELNDRSYGVWFFDVMDSPERYQGKKIRFLATVLRPADFPKGHFVPGRTAMNCCAQDMFFMGFVCKYDRAEELQEKDWITVTAEVRQEFWKDYKGVGPVLYALDIQPAKKPKEEILNLTQ